MKILFKTLLLLCITASFAQQQTTGLLFDDEAYSKVPLKAANMAFHDNLSETPRVSLKQFAPLVKNQGGYGTCVGWASAYYGRTILKARRENNKDITSITNNAFSPIFTYLNSNKEDDYNCAGGAYINKAMRNMTAEGAVFYKDYSQAEFCDTEIPAEVLSKAADNKIKDFTRLFTGEETDPEKIDRVKRSLANGNPVIIGFKIEQAFYSSKNVYTPSDETPKGGHAMCVIGFDNEKYGGAFEIINSWGADWGNKGFIWVKYNDLVKYTHTAFEMIPMPKPKEEYFTLAGELKIELNTKETLAVVQGDGSFKKKVLGWQKVISEEETVEKTLGDYQTINAYPENTKYRMYAKANKPAYVYVFAADSNEQNGVLFPHKEGISTFINYKDAEIVIPGEKSLFQLGGDVEHDYTVVVFSLEKIDTENVVNQLNTLQGDINDKLHIIFNDKMISKKDIKLNKDRMRFEARFKKGTMAIMVLDIKRS